MDKKQEHYLRQLNKESERIFKDNLVKERPNEDLRERLQHAARKIKDDNPRLSKALIDHSNSKSMMKETQTLSEKGQKAISDLQDQVIRGAIQRGEINKAKDDKWLRMHREGTRS